ncbi:hypothetical protein [Roseofilum casamattae]|uniref:Uncharacterized protein n=1 Tax=Roseofilum casamattae BLCC-M143 TaxID=3022442 RepID=A0ABT7BT37_9CYAN|nr:hypothetical protein [Roseofilum casamattae]MDJ1182240.1 hypothetical protein [Roseofilum casamattae BLCC-M143]
MLKNRLILNLVSILGTVAITMMVSGAVKASEKYNSGTTDLPIRQALQVSYLGIYDSCIEPPLTRTSARSEEDDPSAPKGGGESAPIRNTFIKALEISYVEETNSKRNGSDGDQIVPTK